MIPRASGNRLDLSVAQVVASAFAAVTATVGASFLGVAGTVIGAAVASVLTVVANAVYIASLHRTRDRLAGMVPAQTGSRAIPWPGARGTAWRKVRGRPIPWRAVAIGALAVFAVLVGLITIVEATAGRPLSDILRNQPGHGTSFLGGDSGGGGGSEHANARSLLLGTIHRGARLEFANGDTDTEHAEQRPSSNSPAASPQRSLRLKRGARHRRHRRRERLRRRAVSGDGIFGRRRQKWLRARRQAALQRSQAPSSVHRR